MKKFLSSLFCLSLAFSLMACSSSSESSTPSETTSAQASEEKEVAEVEEIEEEYFEEEASNLDVFAFYDGQITQLTVSGNDLEDFCSTIDSGDKTQFTVDLMAEDDTTLYSFIFLSDEHGTMFFADNYVEDMSPDIDGYYSSNEVSFYADSFSADFDQVHSMFIYWLENDEFVGEEFINISDATIMQGSASPVVEEEEIEEIEEVEEVIENPFAGTYYRGTSDTGTKLDEPDMTNVLVISEDFMFTQTIYDVEYTFEYTMDQIDSAQWLELDGSGISVAYEADGTRCNSYVQNTNTGDGYIIAYYRDSYYDKKNNTMSTDELEMLEAEANGL